ncbi:MAG TPA: lipid II flippase MurJ [Candidatus Saccharimonadales bacterium]|nr:lipid II flippase MurJ [Candidatus Saccharimonadales bacterium]HSX27508.1 lipid II flippase MurJ [Patescibacteria group bacterium]
MNRWLTRANQRISLPNAAALLIGTALIGQLLGFMRTQVINGNFNSPGHITTDAYFAAFKIPDFFFYTIAAGALGVAFMPFLADKLEHGDKRAVWQITSGLLNLLGILMVAVGVIMLVFTEPLLRLVVGHNLGPQQTHDAVMIMRIIALNPLLFTISGVLTSLQQTFGRFFFYALGPIIYNVCIITSVYIFKNNLGLTGLAYGALAGAALQLLIVCLGLKGMNFKYQPIINMRSADFRRILRNLPARSIDQGIDSINSIVETNRASVLGTGRITFYENAYTLHLVPILLIGTTIATAAFPRLNERLAQGRPDLFRRDFLQILRVMIWIILPVAVITFFARAYFARLIYKNIAPDIALILEFLVGAIIFRTLYAIISRYFYAQKDTRTPLFVSLFTIALNIVLAFKLAKPIDLGGYGIAGLAIAQSVVAAVEVFILVTIMLWRDHKLFDGEFWGGVARSLSVTGFTVMTTYTLVHIFQLQSSDRGFITLGTKLFLIVVPTFAVHIAISALYGLDEVKPVIAKLRQVMLKPVRIQ